MLHRDNDGCAGGLAHDFALTALSWLCHGVFYLDEDVALRTHAKCQCRGLQYFLDSPYMREAMEQQVKATLRRPTKSNF